MARVTGLGGVFLKVDDRAALAMNFRVDDLHALLAQLRAAGCAVDDKVEESEFGRFGWVTDPEGNKLELWEPPRA